MFKCTKTLVKGHWTRGPKGHWSKRCGMAFS